MTETPVIYVIDDDTALRTAYAASLSRIGYQVETATDGVEGQRLVAKAKPTLIILDLLMPNQDGLSFLKTLRSDPANNNIKVVVASNFEPMAEAFEHGVVKYLSKLLNDPEAIAAKIDEIIKAG